MPIRNLRELVITKSSDKDEFTYDLFQSKGKSNVERTQRGYDKAMTALRIAMNKLSVIMEDLENNWIAYEMIMQQKNVLHNQIDILMKEKRLLNKHIATMVQ